MGGGGEREAGEITRGASSSSSSESNMILRRRWISKALTLGVERGAELKYSLGAAEGVFSGALGTALGAAAAWGFRETYASSSDWERAEGAANAGFSQTGGDHEMRQSPVRKLCRTHIAACAFEQLRGRHAIRVRGGESAPPARPKSESARGEGRMGREC